VQCIQFGLQIYRIRGAYRFWEKPVAIAVARTLGSSYICTSTKDWQTQYSKDFPYLKAAKGKNNFTCLVKEDFIRNGTYRCGSCASSNMKECYHTSVQYGHCMTDDSLNDSGCKYRTEFLDNLEEFIEVCNEDDVPEFMCTTIQFKDTELPPLEHVGKSDISELTQTGVNH